MENEKYLTEQIITYLGNKRKLLDAITYEVERAMEDLNLSKAKICDLFSGSGVVARKLKQYAFPYFFMDFYSEVGLFGFKASSPPQMGSFYWMLFFFAFIYGLSFLFFKFHKKICKKRNKK